MQWLLGGAGVRAWLFPHDLSHDLIGHTHRSCDRSCGISYAHKREDTTRWYKGGVDHTHFLFDNAMLCNACYSFDD